MNIKIYQIIKKNEWVGGLFGWGGLSVVSGLIYTNNNMRFEINKLDTSDLKEL